MFKIGAIILLLASLALSTPYLLKTKIETSFNDSCENCSLKIDHLALVPFPLGLTLKGVHLKNGDPEATEVVAKIESLTTDLSYSALLKGELKISHLRVNSPKVIVTEGDLPTPSSNAEKEQSNWTFSVADTEISNGEFTYLRIYKNSIKLPQTPRQADLSVKNIEGKISALGSSVNFRNLIVKAYATGMLESSGHFTLEIETPLFEEKNKIDLALHLYNQDLASLSPFFIPQAVSALKGKIRDGLATVKIRDQASNTKAIIKYSGLKIHFEKTDTRSALGSAIANLIQSLKINESNLKRHSKDQERTAQGLRNKSDSIILFILNGMKEASLKIATF